MQPWLIPACYMMLAFVGGIVLPRLEAAFLGDLATGISTSAGFAFFSAVGSGMMALTGIVFAIAFVLVQFSAVAYSPRLVVVLAGKRSIFHALGIFAATFTYSLAALLWTDRGGSGRVPPGSTMVVVVLLVASLMLFARMVQQLGDLQIGNVLDLIGAKGRAVIRELFRRLPGDAEAVDAAPVEDLGPVTQALTYSGRPQAIASLDIAALVRLAVAADAVIELACAVGDTLVEDSVMLRVHGAGDALPEAALRGAFVLAQSRTFEQDPKYAIRLLVDIAIRALSPAVNDPTTAVQALDQIEDLLRRLGRMELDAGRAHGPGGRLRVIFPMPSWEDYLSLSFDEIRQYGVTSVQVARRLRAALSGLAETIAVPTRRAAVQRYLAHLDRDIGLSTLDPQDQAAAMQEDRQGLGLSRRPRQDGG